MAMDVGAGYAMRTHNLGELRWRKANLQVGVSVELFARIYHKSEWRKGTVSVKPGTLDDTRWLKPEMHLWTSSKQPWVIIPKGVEAYETQPS
jgi:hypothetical protein